MPVTPGSAVASAKPGSSDQSSQPITLKRGSSVAAVDAHPLDRARRRALAAADLRALEGRAGRARGGEQPVAVAQHDLGVRADVDDQRRSPPPGAAPRPGSRRRCRRRRGRRCRAGRRRGRPGGRAGRARPPAGRTARSVASAKGAPPSSVGSMPEQQVMHDRVADERQLEDVGALDAGLRREPGDQLVERLAHGRGHLRGAASGFIITYETRLIRSSPKRICGFISAGRGEDLAVGQVAEVAGDRGRADVDRDAVGRGRGGPARPRSAARPSWTATVTRQLPAAQRRLQGPEHAEVGRQVGQAPLALERLEEPGEVAGRGGEVGLGDLDVVEPDDRVELESRARRRLLRTTWRWTWLSGGTSITTSPRSVAVQRRAAGPAPGRARTGSAASSDSSGDRCPAVEVMPCFGNSPIARAHLAASADAAPAADRIDVDAERARGVEHGRARGEPAAPAGRREDDERFGHGRDGPVDGSRVGHRRAQPAAGAGTASRRRFTRRPGSPRPGRPRIGPDPAAAVRVVAHQHVGRP